MSNPISDTSKLCIHSITTKPWPLEQALENYANRGVAGISVWQNVVEDIGAKKAGELLRQYPVDVVSYVRGGFFPANSKADRLKAIVKNKKMLDEAAALGAPLLVLVCGSQPELSLKQSRKQIREGMEAILPHARSVGVKLGIEPLHPMYADTRSAINTMRQANYMVEAIGSKDVGVVVDVYHLWWDELLKSEIKRCGEMEALFAFHICDWKVPTEDMLLDRGLMGEGCINILEIREWVEKAGFTGYNEVEIFSNRYWNMEQKAFLDKIIEAYLNYT